MSLKICVLGSSSSGNSIFVASERTRILIDAGLSCREIGRRLELVGEQIDQVAAVCVTHEHDDHTSAIPVLHRRTGAALYANSGTVDGMSRSPRLRDLPWRVFTTGSPFQEGDLVVEPFSVPHDAYDPVGFIVRCEDTVAGFVTDMGMTTALIRERLKECRLVVVEANHDPGLLRDAARPWSLKQRIAGRQGHLSNEQAAALLVELAAGPLETVFLAHLSGDCNRPETAVDEVTRALAGAGHDGKVRVKVTYPDRPSETVVLR